MNSHKLLAYGSLPIRIVAGITLLAHGLPKFENIAGTQGFFGSVGPITRRRKHQDHRNHTNTVKERRDDE